MTSFLISPIFLQLSNKPFSVDIQPQSLPAAFFLYETNIFAKSKIRGKLDFASFVIGVFGFRQLIKCKVRLDHHPKVIFDLADEKEGLPESMKL